MIRITQIRGKKQVQKNIDNIRAVVSDNMYKILSGCSNIIRDKAISNVKSINPQGYAGLSTQGGRITDTESWVIEPLDAYKIALTCTSEHAAVVEIGGTGTLLAKSYGHKGWPVFRQQGIDPPRWAGSVKIQQGKHYLMSAMMSEGPKVNEKIRVSLQKLIWSAIS